MFADHPSDLSHIYFTALLHIGRAFITDEMCQLLIESFEFEQDQMNRNNRLIISSKINVTNALKYFIHLLMAKEKRKVYYFLGIIYYLAHFNMDLAKNNFLYSANMNFKIALNNIGLMYLVHDINTEKALYYLSQASLRKFPISLCILGYLHEKNGEYDQAISCYIEASTNDKNDIL
ncbi:hypothetical protein TRFO_13385 [Tritrichomonas foetus]|uniref:TPR Domain containing protein n=1 Tax=Tritrichomonas foetus TaxID=1144522 RepID=A0A1J4KY84_9EUKA|nr:hypothetical protein TRFO_13385 [Tritrichomonas foetus]|eukprot:OHT16219.1 hypothetical protein TRFO_13385 [Tritrichomonas foetus]